MRSDESGNKKVLLDAIATIHQVATATPGDDLNRYARHVFDRNGVQRRRDSGRFDRSAR